MISINKYAIGAKETAFSTNPHMLSFLTFVRCFCVSTPSTKPGTVHRQLANTVKTMRET